jgi:hypothetical protein
MESVPHRIFTSIERSAAPAFSESRAGNRPDLKDEGDHGWLAVCPRRGPKAIYTQPPSTM